MFCAWLVPLTTLAKNHKFNVQNQNTVHFCVNIEKYNYQILYQRREQYYKNFLIILVKQHGKKKL